MADVARPLGHHVEVFLQDSKELFDALAFSVDFLFLGKDVLRVVRPERIGAAHHLVSWANNHRYALLHRLKIPRLIHVAAIRQQFAMKARL